MIKILLLLSAVFITTVLLAQVPERMSYQAVVRNGKNALVANQPIGLRISILHGAVNGIAVYQEIFKPNPVTNANGLVTTEIGSGTPTIGAFSTIDWANGPYFIKAETDTTGGTNYTITGTTRLLSVPYALHAKTAESFSGTITETDPAFAAWDKDYNDLINKPDVSAYATKDMVDEKITNLDYNDLLNTPDLSIYATKDMANQNITNLADPVNPQDAITKAYVDALLERLEKLEAANSVGFFIDTRDGNRYKFVRIGNQVWMAENLKYLPKVIGTNNRSITEPYYYVYGYHGSFVKDAIERANYNDYGVLYNWPATLNGASPGNSNPSGVQGVCPPGWHLPSLSEWEQLFDFLGGDSIAGGKLKETGTKHWNNPNTGATNESGFTALPGGGLTLKVMGPFDFGGVGGSSFWWSASWIDSIPVHISILHSENKVDFNTMRGYDDEILPEFGFSVRCVKD